MNRATGRLIELPANLDQWPESLRELYEERAGIMEYDGRLSRLEAEAKAEADIRRLWREGYAG